MKSQLRFELWQNTKKKNALPSFSTFVENLWIEINIDILTVCTFRLCFIALCNVMAWQSTLNLFESLWPINFRTNFLIHINDDYLAFVMDVALPLLCVFGNRLHTISTIVNWLLGSLVYCIIISRRQMQHSSQCRYAEGMSVSAGLLPLFQFE